MSDYWPEGNIFEADDEALDKLIEGLTKDAENYADDEDSLHSIHSLLFRVEEEVAHRQLNTEVRRSPSIRLSGTRALRKMIDALLIRLDANRWLLQEAEDELHARESQE